MAKNGMIAWFDDLPWIVKIIFCIPMLDVVWAVYRIVKGVTEGNVLLIVIGILWIIPGGAEKPVKIALEGDTLMKETEHDDWSRDIQLYKKVGVAAIVYNDICVYRNESLTVAR